MLLAVNIGNSSLRFGLFEKEKAECKKSWIINSKPWRALDEYSMIFQNFYKQYKVAPESVQNIVIGSVVPPLTNIVREALYKIHQIVAIIVDRYTPSSVKHQSHQLGTDLYANAIAAHILHKKTSLIIDFGTALSLTCVDKTGQFRGVVIAPGVNTALNALISNTAQLSQIELQKPSTVLGLQSDACIQSGMIYGYLSMVEGLIDRINQELQTSCFVIATGGLSHIYAPLTNKIHFSDKLNTIKGLKILHQIQLNS
ncbi:MAG: type III pantothenate kinase [Flavobacteriales bacterium Tduv]